jgi:hypothetical protein
LLQTQDLADFGFLQIRQNRTNAWVDARIAHAGAMSANLQATRTTPVRRERLEVSKSI